nr:uncharacterized protein LOC127492639 [Oryctolagus cuniculus]
MCVLSPRAWCGSWVWSKAGRGAAPHSPLQPLPWRDAACRNQAGVWAGVWLGELPGGEGCLPRAGGWRVTRQHHILSPQVTEHGARPSIHHSIIHIPHHITRVTQVRPHHFTHCHVLADTAGHVTYMSHMCRIMHHRILHHVYSMSSCHIIHYAPCQNIHQIVLCLAMYHVTCTKWYPCVSLSDVLICRIMAWHGTLHGILCHMRHTRVLQKSIGRQLGEFLLGPSVWNPCADFPWHAPAENCGGPLRSCRAFSFLFFFFKFLFIYLFEKVTHREKERQREGEREVFHSLIQSLVGSNGQSYSDLKPGVRSFLLVSHVGSGVQGLGPSSTAFPGHSRELDWKRSSQVAVGLSLHHHKLAFPFRFLFEVPWGVCLDPVVCAFLGWNTERWVGAARGWSSAWAEVRVGSRAVAWAGRQLSELIHGRALAGSGPAVLSAGTSGRGPRAFRLLSCPICTLMNSSLRGPRSWPPPSKPCVSLLGLPLCGAVWSRTPTIPLCSLVRYSTKRCPALTCVSAAGFQALSLLALCPGPA